MSLEEREIVVSSWKEAQIKLTMQKCICQIIEIGGVSHTKRFTHYSGKKKINEKSEYECKQWVLERDE
jgi:hypothetical protein